MLGCCMFRGCFRLGGDLIVIPMRSSRIRLMPGLEPGVDGEGEGERMITL